MDFDTKKIALFVAGTIFGSAGIAALTSRDAKKVYTYGTAAALRAKEQTMTKVTELREMADDILADAKELNEKYAAEEDAKLIEDTAEAEADADAEDKIEEA